MADVSMSSMTVRLSVLVLVLWGAAALVQADELPKLALVDDRGRAVGGVAVVLTSAVPIEPVRGTPTAEMEQKDLRFIPRVITVETGTEVSFPNNDDTRHHVYSFSHAKTFELQLYRGNEAPPVEFDTPGVVVVGCNIHDSMRGYIYVADSPIHGTTDINGELRLPAFQPSGTPRLTFWHPQLRQAISRDIASLATDDQGRLEVALPITVEQPDAEPKASGLRNRLRQYNNDGD